MAAHARLRSERRRRERRHAWHATRRAGPRPPPAPHARARELRAAVAVADARRDRTGPTVRAASLVEREDPGRAPRAPARRERAGVTARADARAAGDRRRVAPPTSPRRRRETRVALPTSSLEHRPAPACPEPHVPLRGEPELQAQLLEGRPQTRDLAHARRAPRAVLERAAEGAVTRDLELPAAARDPAPDPLGGD